MGTDLFISYAWTSGPHRQWVRLLASQLHLIGYNVKIDEVVDYGSSVSGFMRSVTEAAHVLLVVDENYVYRANNLPDSGVGIETRWMSGAFPDKPSSWLSVLFVGNPDCLLPHWLIDHNPKGFDFTAIPEKNEFPGSLQIDEVWRWIEGLPADKSHAVPLSVVRRRAARLERAVTRRDPALYANPALKGRVTFRYREHSHFTIGQGKFKFKIRFSGHSPNSIHVYKDSPIEDMGLIVAESYDPLTVDAFMTPGDVVVPLIGQSVVLLNEYGIMCVITIEEIQRVVNDRNFVPEHVVFTYEILVEH
ncbi:toll/interleukin-1 receptor domain-containing protein [Pseudomonas sp. 21LCFQ010]|uniref:toll/interleukin-1 receptor domain-containing protein n=1 Tax=Pseudomonas sp. 21LCFQ010 TaxID=2957506 RepID=UPI002097AB24|nr:toll/interleukin-1 receptor domain-containing protein [Pseudomonas sp. 21LCFQ010]MCO8161094.1 toll/interleukin-1 receptor domain-containing protein [Pseudomonas sp. 21LCFQ010]